MVDWFVDSVSGANSNSGTVYTAPKKYLWTSDGTAGLFKGVTKPLTGDTVFVLDGHSENPGAAVSMDGGAAQADAPINVINVASFNSGAPNTLGAARGCLVGISTYVSGYDIWMGYGFYVYGFSFQAGDEFFGATGDGTTTLEGCRVQQNRTGTTKLLQLSSTSAGLGEWNLIDTWVKNASTGSGGLGLNGVALNMFGGKFETAPATAFGSSRDGAVVVADGVDFTGVTTLCAAEGTDDGAFLDVLVKNSYIPSGFLLPTVASSGVSVVTQNCKFAASSDSEEYNQYQGNVVSETAAVRAGGAEVAGAGYSYEMLPATNVGVGRPLKCLTITGQADFSTSKIIDIYIANTTRDLDDSEIFFKLSYPTYNVGGNTIKWARGANWLVAPAAHTDDTTSTWGTSPTFMQKMSVTAGGATDGREGPYQIEVFLTVDVDVFVDPLPVIT